MVQSLDEDRGMQWSEPRRQHSGIDTNNDIIYQQRSSTQDVTSTYTDTWLNAILIVLGHQCLPIAVAAFACLILSSHGFPTTVSPNGTSA